MATLHHDPSDTSSNPTAAPARESVFDLRLAELHATDPLRWLAKGWQDFRRSRASGCFTAPVLR